MDILHRFMSLFKLPLTVYTILRTLYNDYATVLANVRRPPGFPVANPTSSFWQDDPPYPELVDVHTPAGPPRTADVVIIGSGITAAAVARTLLRELDRRGELGGDRARGDVADWARVLVLEARQLCSGATGRNGGHIKASPHELFHSLAHRGMAPGRAAALCAFQTRHVRALGEVARAEDIEAVSEFREVRTVDVAVGEEAGRRMRAQVAEFLPYRPEGYEMVGHGADEAGRLFGADEARVAGAVSYPAGALWPYRFVAALWRRLLDRYPRSLAIETGTVVESVAVRDGTARFPHVLATNRGEILARHVVHATNAFASQLVPGLRGKATGIWCHMTAQRPGQDFRGTDDGKTSWSVVFDQGFDYITQRPGVPGGGEGGGELMIGGGLFQSAKQGMDMFGVYDDSKTDAMTLMHLEGVMPTVFGWGAEARGQGGKSRMIKAWSGIVAFSADMLPLVGRLDARITRRGAAARGSGDGRGGGGEKVMSSDGADRVAPGEWIAAYYCGDGMVWSWLCGTAVGVMLAGSEGESLPEEPGRPAGRLADWFPPELYASWARVQAMDISNLADEL